MGSGNLSLSHDSVFTPDKAREATPSIGELKSSAISMDRLPGAPFAVSHLHGPTAWCAIRGKPLP